MLFRCLYRNTILYGVRCTALLTMYANGNAARDYISVQITPRVPGAAGNSNQLTPTQRMCVKQRSKNLFSIFFSIQCHIQEQRSQINQAAEFSHVGAGAYTLLTYEAYFGLHSYVPHSSLTPEGQTSPVEFTVSLWRQLAL